MVWARRVELCVEEGDSFWIRGLRFLLGLLRALRGGGRYLRLEGRSTSCGNSELRCDAETDFCNGQNGGWLWTLASYPLVERVPLIQKKAQLFQDLEWRQMEIG